MPAIKSILKNINILNGILFGTAAIFAYVLVIPFLNMDIQASIPEVIQPVAGENIQSTAAVNPSPVDFALISDQNLFHPERKIPAEKAEAKVIPRPDIILYGTLVTNDISIAYIEDKRDPKTTLGRGKRQIAAQKGYNVGGYILRQIEPDRIVLVKGEDHIVVRLEESEKRRDNKETTNTPVTAGMSPSGLQPSTSAIPHPAQRTAPAASAASRSNVPSSSSVQAVPVPGSGANVVPATRPHSRQGISQEVQQMKQDMLRQAQ